MRFIIFFALLFFVDGQHAFASKRIALVVGNSVYRNVPVLPNPSNDAKQVAALFRAAGFDRVDFSLNLGISEMRKMISDLAEAANDSDVAVVYFAGHGVEIDGSNYLIPVDARLRRDFDVEDEAVSLERILKATEPAKRLRLVIIDACRDNPFLKTMKRTIASRSIGRGLAKIEPQLPDTLIAFAAKAGSVALDGDAKNSPFTSALLHNIATPGLDLRLAFGRVRDDVWKTTNHGQEPFVYGSLGGSVVALVDAPAEPPRPKERPADDVVWDTIKSVDEPAVFDEFMKKFPASPHAADAQTRRGELKRKTAALAAPPPPEKPAKRTDIGLKVLTAEQEAALKPKVAFKECSKCPEMVVVPAGDFIMGSPDDEPNRQPAEGPQHSVTIPQPFAVGRFAVTFDGWDACVADGGCNGYRPWDNGWGRGMRPVINVSWDDAQAYVAWLSRRTGKRYRLLSEVEREYVTRAGKTSAYWQGASISKRDANYNDDGAEEKATKVSVGQKTLPVDSFQPNPFDLYQVHGNVWEWISDCLNENFAGRCEKRGLRGGSWVSKATDLRSASRYGVNPNGRVSNVGFRVARDLSN